MKYSTFIKLVEQEGLKVNNLSYLLGVYDSETGDTLITISKETILTFSTDYQGFIESCDHYKKTLSDWAIKLASTPLDEREDEKRYYVKFMEKVYLVYYPKSRNYGVVSTREGAQGKTQFTEQEIKNYDSRFWTFAEEVKEDE